LLIMGFGDGSKTSKIIESRVAVSKNLILIDAVPQAEILSWTSAADVGLHLIEDLSFSYQLSMGNKFFEYLFAGIPIISTYHPDAREIINRYEVGWIIDNVADFHDLANSLSMEVIEAKKQNTAVAWEKYNWENQEKKYQALYKQAFERKT